MSPLSTHIKQNKAKNKQTNLTTGYTEQYYQSNIMPDSIFNVNIAQRVTYT